MALGDWWKKQQEEWARRRAEEAWFRDTPRMQQEMPGYGVLTPDNLQSGDAVADMAGGKWEPMPRTYGYEPQAEGYGVLQPQNLQAAPQAAKSGTNYADAMKSGMAIAGAMAAREDEKPEPEQPRMPQHSAPQSSGNIRDGGIPQILKAIEISRKRKRRGLLDG